MPREFSKHNRLIGAHVSISGGIGLSVERAIETGCVGTFQIFTCNPRQWNAIDLNPSEIEQFLERSSQASLAPFVHMPYLPNLSSPDRQLYLRSCQVLVRELHRCAQLGLKFLVIHLGSHSGSSLEEGQERLVAACRSAISETADSKVCILLENTAGTRNSLGSTFENIRRLFDGIGERERTGVCLDTCHLFASGYDISSKEGVKDVMMTFGTIVGFENLYLIHLNDSKGMRGEGRDRHEHIGLGRIGDAGFRALFALKEIGTIPLIVETDNDPVRDQKGDIAHIKTLL